MTELDDTTPACVACGTKDADDLPPARVQLRAANEEPILCKPCGEAASHKVVRTVVPMHKSNYFYCTNLADLHGINNKGGIVR
jgi:hypothetical protein